MPITTTALSFAVRLDTEGVSSLALYFSGRRETAIFVGLRAPTVLNPGQSMVDED